MQKRNISIGAIAALLLAVGVVFKVQHWPGANITSGVGVLLFVLVFVIFLISNVKTLAGGLEKASGFSSALTLLVVLVAYYFKLMHWPGAGILVALSLIGLLTAGIILFIDAIKETDQPKHGIKLLLGSTFLIFAAINFLIIYAG